MVFGAGAYERKIKQFWEWFARVQERYFNDLEGTAEAFTELSNRMKKIHKSLTFEFSSHNDDGTREFIISADGNIRAFPDVVKTVELAPPLGKWKIIAFRQPKREITSIALNDVTIELDDVYFQANENGSKLDVMIFFKEYEDNGFFRTLAFIVLDIVLGEYETEIYIGNIHIEKMPEQLTDEIQPIKELPLFVEKIKNHAIH